MKFLLPLLRNNLLQLSHANQLRYADTKNRTKTITLYMLIAAILMGLLAYLIYSLKIIYFRRCWVAGLDIVHSISGHPGDTEYHYFGLWHGNNYCRAGYLCIYHCYRHLGCYAWFQELQEWRYKAMIETWILCPVCDSKTRVRIREDTVLENFPLYCPKCKHETLISARQLNISVIKEPDAQTQSR